jgi:ankyrin repeat protein
MKKHMIIFMLTLLFSCFTSFLSADEIHEAAKRGDIEKVRSILSSDKSQLEAKDRVGYTPLNWAAMRAKWDMVKFLLDMGANTNSPGFDKCTSLHCASHHDNKDIIELLINKGADHTFKNAWGNTPLHVAAQRGCKQSAAMLIAKGANLQATSNEGWTPLHYAFKCGHKALRKLLIEAGASKTTKDKYGKTPLEYDFTRPSLIPMDKSKYNDYVGDYAFGGGFFAKVWIENERLMLEDYAHDEIYPIAKDTFYCKQEPWKITFYRNESCKVDKIALGFQRRTLVCKKVADRNVDVYKPNLGIQSKSPTREDLSVEDLQFLFFDLMLNSNVHLITSVQENSAAEKAGIKVNDILFEFNKTKLVELGDLQRLMFDTLPGAYVPIKLFRAGKVIKLMIEFE